MVRQSSSSQEMARFTMLQASLASCFRRFCADPKRPYTAVVIPSQSFDPKELAKIPGVAHYEERSLFNLMLLRHPRLEVVFVTSKRLNPLIVDYYLHQLRGVPGAHARRRLHLLDCDDATPIPLTQKILARPRVVGRIRDAIVDPDNAHMVVFNATDLERSLAVQLGIPINASSPDLVHLGHKTGSREVFQAAGLRVAPGRQGLRDVKDLCAALASLWDEVPGARRVVVKLDDSFSGEGNAILEMGALAGARGASAGDKERAIRDALRGLRFEAEGLDWEAYAGQFDAMGGICEQWIEGEGKRSPSTQLRINPLGEVQVVSTHDQVLGGPSGQIFQGATFPADAAYRSMLQDGGRRVGEVLADRGVRGRFGVDFLTVPKEGGHELYAVEINLRQGGTTHPFNTMKFITDGHYDEATGVFRTRQGSERCYFATDTLSAPGYCGILPFDLIDEMVVEGIHFRSDETGVVFHLLGCLSEFGKLGLTAIGESIDDAHGLYRDAVALLDRMSR
jgi:PGM1 C-terminal domain